MVAIGVDSHKSSLAAAAVDDLGRVIAAEVFGNDPAGHANLLVWAKGRSTDRRIGIECSGTYGAALARYLSTAGEDVREVPASLAHRERKHKPSPGKSDPIDAVAIARVVAREQRLPDIERSQVLTDLRSFSDYLDQLTRSRNQLTNRIHRDLLIWRPGYEAAIPKLVSKKHLRAVLTLLEGDRSVTVDLIRRRVVEVQRLDQEIAEIKRLISAKLEQSGTTLMELPGIGPIIAAKILGQVGDIRRVRSSAAFARICGTAPIAASSGTTSRHRLNRGGNRQLNHAVHYMALVQYRSHPESRNYIERRRQEGKSHKEAMRCLKRHLSNVIYRRLAADAAKSGT